MAHDDTDRTRLLSRRDRRDVAIVVAGLGGFITLVCAGILLSDDFRKHTQLDPNQPEKWEIVEYKPGEVTKRPATTSALKGFKYGAWIVAGLYVTASSIALLTFVQAVRGRRTVLTRIVLWAMSRRV